MHCQNHQHPAPVDQTPAEDGEEEEFVDGELCEGPITFDKFIKSLRKKYQSYTDLFELAIPRSMFSFKNLQEVREKVKESFRKLASSVKSTYASTRGRERYKLDSRTRKFHVFEGYVRSVADLEMENEELDMQNDELKEFNSSLCEELEVWKNKHQNLEEEIEKLFNEMRKEIEELQSEVAKVEATNQEPLSYVEKLQNAQQDPYKGKDISQVKKKSRTLRSFMTRAQTALWFAKSFGLDIEAITLRESKSGKKDTATMATDEPTNTSGFGSLSEEEKQSLIKFCLF